MPKHELSWTNVGRGDLSADSQKAWDAYVAAKETLETAIALDAVESGAASEGDAFKFSYMRFAQGTIGMAIDTPSKASRAGFSGLKRPVDQREVEAEKLANWQERQRAAGRRF